MKNVHAFNNKISSSNPVRAGLVPFQPIYDVTAIFLQSFWAWQHMPREKNNHMKKSKYVYAIYISSTGHVVNHTMSSLATALPNYNQLPRLWKLPSFKIS